MNDGIQYWADGDMAIINQLPQNQKYTPINVYGHDMSFILCSVHVLKVSVIYGQVLLMLVHNQFCIAIEFQNVKVVIVQNVQLISYVTMATHTSKSSYA